jgi:hypothetical protein
MINAYKMLVGEPTRKRPPEGSKCRSDDNTKMALKEMDFK